MIAYAANELKAEGILGSDKNSNREEHDHDRTHQVGDIQGGVTPERRKRIDAFKAQAHADTVHSISAHSAKPENSPRSNSQNGRRRPSVSAMENAGDKLVSTVRPVVESPGGHLEMVAVFGDERIALEIATSK